MGLDSVEIVLRAEEFFNIAIGDGEAAQVRTVGDFYVLICGLLGIVPLKDPVTRDNLPIITEWKKSGLFFRKAVHLPPPADVRPWSPENVWNCLVAIFVDQQGLKQDRVRYGARIADHNERIADPDLRRTIDLEPSLPAENLLNKTNHLFGLRSNNPRSHGMPAVPLKALHRRCLGSSLPQGTTPIPQEAFIEVVFGRERR